MEKYYEFDPNSPKNNPSIIFGVPAESNLISPTRLFVRDAFLTDESKEKLENLETDLPYSEVKTEVTIDRVTSKANPRQMERVPAGTEFDFEFVVNIYRIDDGDKEETDNEKELLNEIFKGMILLQDDYLGGSGSRGYGKVKFRIKDLMVKTEDDYKNLEKEKPFEFEIPDELK